MSKIQWTEESWNPIAGCSKVSPGCANCYAERMSGRLQGLAIKKINDNEPPGSNEKYIGTVRDGKWTGTIQLDFKSLDKPKKWRKPKMIFVCSMSDLFHEDVPSDVIDKVFETMEDCSQHTFQVLTKRPQRMASYTRDRLQRLMRWAPNVWLGTSVEDQERADERIPRLAHCPAALRFLSCEPLLGALNLKPFLDARIVDWVIVGGESGLPLRSRPSNLEWYADIIAQCRRAKVPVFVKQLGTLPHLKGERWHHSFDHGGDPEDWPRLLRVREMPEQRVRAQLEDPEEPMEPQSAR